MCMNILCNLHTHTPHLDHAIVTKAVPQVIQPPPFSVHTLKTAQVLDY